MKNDRNVLLSLISLSGRVFIIFQNVSRILQWLFDGLATIHLNELPLFRFLYLELRVTDSYDFCPKW